MGGRTSLHLACGNGHVEIVRLLLSNKANVNDEDKVSYKYWMNEWMNVMNELDHMYIQQLNKIKYDIIIIWMNEWINE